MKPDELAVAAAELRSEGWAIEDAADGRTHRLGDTKSRAASNLIR